MEFETVQSNYLHLILPLIAIQLGLLAMALYDWLKRKKEDFRYLTKWPWLIIISLISTLGSLAYLIIHRKKQ